MLAIRPCPSPRGNIQGLNPKYMRTHGDKLLEAAPATSLLSWGGHPTGAWHLAL